jgi:hypothetical protein
MRPAGHLAATPETLTRRNSFSDRSMESLPDAPVAPEGARFIIDPPLRFLPIETDTAGPYDQTTALRPGKWGEQLVPHRPV